MAHLSWYHVRSCERTNMNMRKLFTLLALFMIACPIIWAQDSAATDKDLKFPSRGVRFVICSPSNQALPAPLYVKVDKEYLPVTISSRMPSPRLGPEKGEIKFYDQEPDANAKEKDLKPFLTIAIPEAHRSKSICVVQPRNDGGKPKTYFFKEAEFARGGIYVVNLTPAPLEILTSDTGKFGGEEKKSRIAPGKGNSEISLEDKNVWHFMGGKKDKTRIPFALRTLSTDPKTPGRRIIASVMQTLPTAAQVSFVVEHPAVKGSYKVLSIQYSDDSSRTRPENTPTAR